jgi:predicted transcriptional regulator
LNSQARAIEEFIFRQPENKILTAKQVYKQLPEHFSEQAFYQTLTRLTQKGMLCHLTKGLYYRPRCSRFGVVPLGEQAIVEHYTAGGQGMVVGYRLYYQLGLTTQISKNVDILSNVLQENKKTVSNVKVSRLDLNFDATICNAIATLEILQNYRNIEDINHRQMAEYMRKFALNYSEDAIRTVLGHCKYKKATIAFLAAFLGYWNTKHTLQQYLSRLSTYAVPQMEEFYAST